MRIGILGDVMLGRAVGEWLADGRPEDVWSPELRDLCRSLDVVICNLECCISTRGRQTERIPHKPFFFRGPPRAIESLRAINVAAVSLANNHALDYEVPALEDTLYLLPAAGIAVAGAGRTDTEARRGAIIEVAGARIGVLCFSDHPRVDGAGLDEPGIAFASLHPDLPDWLAEEARRAVAECDHVIAFPHWGQNMVQRPTKRNRRAARRLQQLGVGLVVGHSAHVFHGAAWTRRGPILYDLGDALDDYARDGELRNDLGLLAIWTPGESGGAVEVVGLKLEHCHTRLAEGADARWIGDRLMSASARLGGVAEPVSDTLGRWRIHR